MKWFLLIFLPFFIAFSAFVAFAQPITALIWIPSFVAMVVVMTWYYQKHHQGESPDAWEVQAAEWKKDLDRYVEKVKIGREHSEQND